MKKRYLIFSICLLGLWGCSRLQVQPSSEAQSLSTALPAAYGAAGLTDREAARILLSRFTFGARPGQEDDLLAMGLAEWFQQQLGATYADAELSARLKTFDVLGMDDAQLMQTYPGFSEARAHIRRFYPGILPARGEPVMDFSVINAKLAAFAKEHGMRKVEDSLLPQLEGQRVLRAVYSENQLREVMVEFWSNHFVTSTRNFGARPWVLGFENQVLRRHGLGEFDALLQASTRHPAMLGSYRFDAEPTTLAESDSLMAIKAGELRAQDKTTQLAEAKAVIAQLDEEYSLILERRFWPATGPNKVFARDLLRQQTLGPDADLSDADLANVARAFTGWGVYRYGPDERWFTVDANVAEPLGFTREGSFWFRADQHDATAKTVLGHTLSAGQGVADGEQVLQLLADHPATARHIAGKLANYFIGSEASPALVEHLADVFSQHDGDIKMMLIELVSSPGFWRDAAKRDQVKTPFHYVVSAMRHTQADIQTTAAISNWLEDLGQPPYGYLASSGYPHQADYWLSAGTVLARINFARALQQGEVAGVSAPADAPVASLLASPEFQLH